MSNTVRIGTRESVLAMWQAEQVRAALADNDFEVEIVPVKSEGDQDLVTPLYAFGVQGIFTRSLDAAILNDRIDIAVHSMKDVPVLLPEGIIQLAVLERGPWADILILNEKHAGKNWEEICKDKLSIATSSIRRRAQWLNRFPDHKMVDLRGNIATRIRKIREEDWDGAIFAEAGLHRLGLLQQNEIPLDWMLPAPAQGAIMVVGRADLRSSEKITSILNDPITAQCVKAERDFLQELLGGCSTPISAHAHHKSGMIHFRGSIHTPDGQETMSVELKEKAQDATGIGLRAAENMVRDGGQAIISKIK